MLRVQNGLNQRVNGEHKQRSEDKASNDKHPDVAMLEVPLLCTFTLNAKSCRKGAKNNGPETGFL